jgi:hypothetical protein
LFSDKYYDIKYVMLKLPPPPFERVADFRNIEISADRGIWLPAHVAVDEAPKGEQMFPVGIYEPEGGSKHPLGTAMIATFSWSASNYPDYQRARLQAFADIWGMPIIAINSIGQGVGSPDMTDLQTEQMHKGDADDVGRVMIEGGLQVYEQHFGYKLNTAILFGPSQGASLHPAMVKHLPDNVEVPYVFWVTAAGLKEGLPAGLLPALGRAAIPAQDMNEYRDRNLPEFNLLDTNVPRNLITQFGAHLIYYTALMRSGRLAADMRSALRGRDLNPQIHNFFVEYDWISPPQYNHWALEILGKNVVPHYLKGHNHNLPEYIGYLAAQVAAALGTEIPTIQDRPKIRT